MTRPASFAVLVLTLAPAVFALDPPDELAIRAFLKPSGGQLHVLLRVPLKALNGIAFPSGAKGELDLAGVEAVLPSAARWWLADNIEVWEGNTVLPKPRVVEARVSLPSDNSFASYDDAIAHVTGGGLPGVTQVLRDQALVDVLLDYPIHSESSSFAIHSSLSRLGARVSTDLQFLGAAGLNHAPSRTFEYSGDPGLFRLDPRWYQAAQRFVVLGFSKILEGADALLFLFCAALLFRGYRALVPFAVAFTVAHSVTLIASAYDLASDALWFPVLIETLMAISIVYLAFSSIAAAWRKTAGGTSSRWMLGFGCGLVYGFGFAFALRPALQFAGSHTLASVVSFNAGIELGQYLTLALLVPVLDLMFRFTSKKQMETTILAALAADLGWHRFTDRADRLSQFSWRWPMLDAALLASAMGWLTIFLVLGGVACLVLAVYRHRKARAAVASKPPTSSPATPRLDLS
jgi:hypothetical protein